LVWNGLKLQINVFAEKPGWITHRLDSELVFGSSNYKLHFGLQSKLKLLHMNFSSQTPFEPIINYYIPYYLLPEKKVAGAITVACLTHFEHDNSFKRIGWERALVNSDYFVAISKFTYEQAISQGVDKSKIKIITYGVSKHYKPTYNILIVGTSGKRKGQDFLQEVMKLCDHDKSLSWKSASEPGWDLDIICNDATDLRNAYGWADLIFVPSNLEGAHTGTLEALVSGVPVLSRDTGWARYELKNYVNIIKTYRQAADFILNSAREKNKLNKTSGFVAEDLGFSYDFWRSEHLKLFTELAN
jgi:glycosyltransferase involved in cell wall biosynthesis